MFFVLSKVLWLIITPLNLIWLLILSGALLSTRHMKWGISLLFTGCFLFLLLGIAPIGHNLTVLLERQYPRPALSELPARVDGIIVLGGAFNSMISEETNQISANSNIGRMVDFIALSNRYPDAKLVFSGGSGRLGKISRKESDDAKEFLEVFGIDTSDIIFERESRNTFENVKFSKALLSPQRSENWIVVTSAFHLPRTMGIFEHHNWLVIPYGAAPKTNGEYRLIPNSFKVTYQFHLLENALKEWVGSITYYFSGKSAFLLPLRPLISTQNQEKGE